MVYNSSRFRKQCVLWHELSKITSLHLPWPILGDFNSILHRCEHMSGSFAYHDRKARFFFSDFVDNNNLIDLNNTGPLFTWCNNQSGLARWWARQDHCPVNLMWINLFNTNNLKHLNRPFSHHAPLFLSSSSFPFFKKNFFQFENFWFDYVGCHSAVHDAWNHTPMATLCTLSRIFSLVPVIG